MPHICHITTMHQTFDTRIFKRECVSLAQAGYNVSIIAPHTKREVVDGVKIIPIRRPRSYIDRIYNLPREAVKIANVTNADLYHFHDPELVPVMRNLARSVNKPVIWDAHENYVDTIVSFNSLKLRPVSYLGSKWFDKLEIGACKDGFSGVVTINADMATRYISHGIKTCIAGNFVDLNQIKCPSTNTDNPKPLLMSTGAQFKPRMVLEIAQSLNIIRAELDAEVAFCGSYPDVRIKEEIKAMVQDENLGSLKILGPYPWCL